MATFKCKMCGGEMDVDLATSVATCQYCGSKMTLPRLDDVKRANLYDRANHFRRASEFDKAEGIYETILAEDKTDAEAYWSLVLCKYGITYVKDPKTGKMVPTCNRTQITPVSTDENYIAALHYADPGARQVYQSEAQAIDAIQKGILQISSNEKPYDVFICYKESDLRGQRTTDSVIAQDLYNALEHEGIRTFFARITLEDKLGSAYEPYIFAALNSAQVMVVVSTSAENANAPWVKNEWSRYLALIKGGAAKTLVPAYSGMDPYDLPDEFSHLQAQDLGKVGAIQDIVWGIRKLLGKRSGTENASQTATGISLDSLIKRGLQYCEDGDFKTAGTYFNHVLDTDPDNGDGYIGKLMVEFGAHKFAGLEQASMDLQRSNNYARAVQYASPEKAAALKQMCATVKKRIQAQDDLERRRREEAAAEEAKRKEQERIETLAKQKAAKRNKTIGFVITVAVCIVSELVKLYIMYMLCVDTNQIGWIKSILITIVCIFVELVVGMSVGDPVLGFGTVVCFTILFIIACVVTVTVSSSDTSMIEAILSLAIVLVPCYAVGGGIAFSIAGMF